MRKSLESKLQDALRPVAPSEEFSRTLLTRATATRLLPSQRVRAASRLPKGLAWWSGASLAASVLVAFGIQHHLQAERERALGMQARREVIEALRVTSQKLDLAYRAVRTQSSAFVEADPGV
jgi:hypothetical protein